MSSSTSKGVLIGIVVTVVIAVLAFFVFDYMRLKNTESDQGKSRIESKKERQSRHRKRSDDPDSITENTKKELKRKTNKEIKRTIRKW